MTPNRLVFFLVLLLCNDSLQVLGQTTINTTTTTEINNRLNETSPLDPLTTVPCSAPENRGNATNCLRNPTCWYNASDSNDTTAVDGGQCLTRTLVGVVTNAASAEPIVILWCVGYFPLWLEVVLYLLNCATLGYSAVGSIYIFLHRNTPELANKYGEVMSRKLPPYMYYVTLLWLPWLMVLSLLVGITYFLYWMTSASCVHVPLSILYFVVLAFTALFGIFLFGGDAIRQLLRYLRTRAQGLEAIQRVLEQEKDILLIDKRPEANRVRCF